MQHRRHPQLRGGRASGQARPVLRTGLAWCWGGRGAGRCVFVLPLSLVLLFAQTEASFQLLGAGTSQTRTITAQRNEAIDPETLGKDQGESAAGKKITFMARTPKVVPWPRTTAPRSHPL